MDPLLQPLWAPLTSLHGVGKAVAEKIARVAEGDRVLDLLFHMPEGYLDRSNTPLIADAQAGTVATLLVEVVGVEEGVPPRPWKVIVRDRSGFAEIAYFGRRPPSGFKKGAVLAISGRIETFSGRVQLRNPDRVAPLDRAGELAGLEPVWPLTAGLFPGQVRRAMAQALAAVPELPEWHDAALMRREGWPGFKAALWAVQAPAGRSETAGPSGTAGPPGEKPRARLAYDELLAHQLALAWARQRDRRRPGKPIRGDGSLRREALARFGHAPTPAQLRALAEIDADLAAPLRMLRLLQGDVGTGKTLVALLAMLSAAEAGRQAALMAPTEVLAKQHHRTLSRLSPVPVVLLTGSVKGAERREALGGVEAQVSTFFDFAGLPEFMRSFGIQANYTYLDAKTEFANAAQNNALTLGDIQGVSKHGYNIVGLFERGGVSARLTYNGRSRFLDFRQSRGDEATGYYVQYGKPADRLDLSVNLNFTPAATLFFDATNLTGNADVYSFQSGRGGAPIAEYIRFLRFTERTFSVGMRFHFGK